MVTSLGPIEAPGKSALLAAALKLFAEKGIDATSIRDIGAAAGLTNPALFRHFSGKDELALRLFERVFARLRAALPEVDDRPFEAQLRATLAAYFAFVDEDPAAALYFQENVRRLWRGLPDALRRQSLLGHFRALLEAGVAQGVVRADDDPQLLIVLLTGVLAQFTRQLFFREIPGPAASRLDDICELVMRGFGRQGER